MARPLVGLLLVAGGLTAPSFDAPPAAAAAGSVLMVGDSTMRGMSAAAQNVIRASYDLTFDSGSCRRLIVASCKPIPNALSVIQANPGRDAIVIMTGYNDWTVGTAVDVIMAEAARQGVQSVIWLTYRTDIVEGAQKPIAISQVFRQHNQELAAKAPVHPSLLVLDWDGYSAGRADWFAWDGFHLATPGGFALADLLTATLNSLNLARCRPSAASGTPTVGPAPQAPSAAAPAGLVIPAVRRLLDTRPGDADGSNQPVGSGRSVLLSLVGLVPAGTTSVLVNLGAVDPCGAGFLTAYPCGSVPLASNVNFVRGRTVANLAAVRLDAAGRLCIYSAGQTDLLVDLLGAFAPDGQRFNFAAPTTRLVDTRDGYGAAIKVVGRVASHTPLAIRAIGWGGVPASASALALDIIVVDPTAAGYLTAYPCGPLPWVSNLNFRPGQNVANLAVVRPAANGTVCLVANVATHVVVDLVGWFDDTGLRFASSTPQRLLDTRAGGAPPIGPAGTVSVPVGEGMLVNVTAVAPSGPGFLRLEPCGQGAWVSTLNYGPGEVVPNLAPAGRGNGGAACVYLQQRGHVVVDKLGSFVP